MPTLDSFTTFSGVAIFLGTMCLFLGLRAVGSVLYIIIGSAGVGIFWDRWSLRVGNQDQIGVLFSGDGPTFREIILLSTHGPLLVIGLVILVLILAPGSKQSTQSLAKIVDDGCERQFTAVRSRYPARSLMCLAHIA